MHNSVWISLPFPADQQQKQTEIAICSQNCVWNLEFAIDFWCLQLTFDVFNWVYSKHMIHYNKVNWKNFAKYFLKFFPIDFQYPIDFSQLHMIRPVKSLAPYLDILSWCGLGFGLTADKAAEAMVACFLDSRGCKGISTLRKWKKKIIFLEDF